MTPIFSALTTALFAPLFFGSAGIALFGRTRVRSIQGLLFHSITDDRHSVALSSITRNHFISIVNSIKTRQLSAITINEAQLSHTLHSLSTPTKYVLLTFDDGCKSFFTRALPVLEQINFKATIFPIAGYIGRDSSWDIFPSYPHLTKTELLEISSLGHEIGSHSLTHPDLTRLKTSDLLTELHDSKKILEDITGKKVTALSFPYGCWNHRVWQHAQEIGYTCCALYRKNQTLSPAFFPVFGVYQFDTPHNVVSRIISRYPLSLSIATARIMSHFAKGTPLWKFNKKYKLVPQTNC